MLPKLVDMAQLFELFVAEWLKQLSNDYYLNPQESNGIDSAGNINLRIDLIIFRIDTTPPIYVLVTKYKETDLPSQDDIAQVNLYTGFINCNQAILVFSKE